MKKWNKRIIKTVTITIASLFLFAGGVYAGANYVEWDGSDDYRASDSMLDKIHAGIEGLRNNNAETKSDLDAAKTDLAVATTDLAAANKAIDEQDKTIKDQKKTIEERDKTIATQSDEISELETQKKKLEDDVADIIKGVNVVNGKGQKFDYLRDEINGLGLGAILGTSDSEYNGKSNKLDQATTDMGNIKDKIELIQDELLSEEEEDSGENSEGTN